MKRNNVKRVLRMTKETDSLSPTLQIAVMPIDHSAAMATNHLTFCFSCCIPGSSRERKGRGGERKEGKGRRRGKGERERGEGKGRGKGEREREEKWEAGER